MKYNICYAIACNIGKVRSINQDNFWCVGKYLEATNNGLESIENGEVSFKDYPAFAVFDGMGGEQYGEIAAHIAAETFNSLRNKASPPDIKGFLIDTCKQMNNSITAYANEKSIECIGTTAAIVMCGDKEIYICNIGDSKIYQYQNKNLSQISKDHVIDIFNDRKPPLSQFLGIPEIEFIIEPYIAHGIYNDGDCYLICSDGLTDMLTEEDIKNILSNNKDIKTCVNILLDDALLKGGIDNITIILCKIQKRRKSIFRKLFIKNKIKNNAGGVKGQ